MTINIDQTDEDDFFAIMPVLEEAPVFQEEETTLADMDLRIRELTDLALDISGTGGMSQHLAMEAERILPNVLSHPSGYFTKAPSATNYRVAMEEIHKGIWALVAAAAVAVIAAIYKIYKWLSGSSDSGDKGSAKGAAAKVETLIADVAAGQSAVPEAAAAMQNVASDLRSNPITYTDRHGKTIEYRNMEQIIDMLFLSDSAYGNEKAFLLKPPPVYRDIVEHGPYSQLIALLAKGKIFSLCQSQVEAKLKVLEEVIHQDRNASGDIVVGLIKKLDTVKTPITPKFNGKTLTLSEIASIVRDERTKATENKSMTRIHYDDMFSRLEKVYSNKDLLNLLHQVLDYMPTVTQMEEKLEQLKGFIGDLSQDNNPGGNTAPIAQRARAIIGDLGHQIVGFASLMNEIKLYCIDMKRLESLTVGFGKELVKKVVAHMDASEVSRADIPKEWKLVKAGIEGALSAMQKSHYPSGVSMSNPLLG